MAARSHLEAFGGQKTILDPDNGARPRMNAGGNCAIEHQQVWIESRRRWFG
jgi:hypothetical protein